MRRFFKLIVAAAVSLVTFSCVSKVQEETSGPSFNVSGIVLPETIECTSGETISLTVLGGHGPLSTDSIILEGIDTFTAPVSAVTDNDFSFVLPENIYSSEYAVYVRRGDSSKRVGRTTLFVNTGAEVDPSGANVYGQVVCKGAPVAGVVVSDGVEVTTTDSDGIYRLTSKKKHKYVFISSPSGYVPLSNGILPIFHKQLVEGTSVAERRDFYLVPDQGQENGTILLLGDIHLADRVTDRKLFQNFIDDINAYVASSPGNVYGLTLGDMTWDIYWVVNNYGYREYLQDINKVKGLQIYHTIGNHDHSMYFAGDYDTVTEYKQLICPTYYSYNLGGVHFVVLDDVECRNSRKTQDEKGNPCYERDYDANIVDEQLAWMRKDLALLPAGTPLVVSMHIPLYNPDGTYRNNISHAIEFESIVKPFQKVHVFTAHTHTVYNVDNLSGNGIFEHNSGSICGTWWWSAYETPGVHIGQDGSPGGYAIFSLGGGNFSWQYKATGSPLDYQFITYDRNSIHITADKYTPAANATYRSYFEPGGKWNSGIWAVEDKSNQVYINVWNWDPSWKVEVYENGSPLAVKQVSVKDPLHLIAYTAKRINKNAEASFATEKNAHTFMVTAGAPDTTLEIKVTDRFGNVYSESMTRPKEFTTDIYAK